MIKGAALQRSSIGATLIELMVGIIILGLLVSPLLHSFKNASRGVVMIQKKVPLQAEFQKALSVVQGDLLSASRSSLASPVDGGFEKLALSTASVLTDGQWRIPIFVVDAFDAGNNADARLASLPHPVHSGRYSLLLWQNGVTADYAVEREFD